MSRSINRKRSLQRPTDPISLEFELEKSITSDFLIADVWAHERRHLLFATDVQLNLLKEARRWYIDGTFKIVDKPFYQLLSFHAFLRKGNSVAQVPLAYAIMSGKNFEDY